MSAAIIQFPSTTALLPPEPEAPNKDEIHEALMLMLRALQCGSLHPATARLMAREIVEDAARVERSQTTEDYSPC